MNTKRVFLSRCYNKTTPPTDSTLHFTSSWKSSADLTLPTVLSLSFLHDLSFFSFFFSFSKWIPSSFLSRLPSLSFLLFLLLHQHAHGWYFFVQHLFTRAHSWVTYAQQQRAFSLSASTIHQHTQGIHVLLGTTLSLKRSIDTSSTPLMNGTFRFNIKKKKRNKAAIILNKNKLIVKSLLKKRNACEPLRFNTERTWRTTFNLESKKSKLVIIKPGFFFHFFFLLLFLNHVI